jgi:hypothetical protein
MLTNSLSFIDVGIVSAAIAMPLLDVRRVMLRDLLRDETDQKLDGLVRVLAGRL